MKSPWHRVWGRWMAMWEKLLLFDCSCQDHTPPPSPLALHWGGSYERTEWAGSRLSNFVPVCPDFSGFSFESPMLWEFPHSWANWNSWSPSLGERPGLRAEGPLPGVRDNSVLSHTEQNKLLTEGTENCFEVKIGTSSWKAEPPGEIRCAQLLSPGLWLGVVFCKAFDLLVSTVTENPLACLRMVEVNILLITIVRCIVSLLAILKYGF